MTSQPSQQKASTRYVRKSSFSATPGLNIAGSQTNSQSPPNSLKFSLRVAEGGNRGVAKKARVSSKADRILDAPDVTNDYYLNLLSWSDSDVLAVALSNKVYLWNSTTGCVQQVVDSDQNITSVSWMPGGRVLATGDESTKLNLYDVTVGKKLKTVSYHSDRISSLAWSGSVISSGSRDSSIVHYDIRAQDYFLRNTGHDQEVCGLRWSPDSSELASGGNDNKLLLWDLAMGLTPRLTLSDHKAAVKAIAYCPWKSGVLASGAGSNDKCIKLWSTINGDLLNSVETGSQVCALEWNRYDQELLSAHGYVDNQLSLWKYPEMSKITDYVGHTDRVLCLAQSPDGSTIVSLAADETLRFWNVFSPPTQESKKNELFICR